MAVRRRRMHSARDKWLIVTVATITLLLTLSAQGLYRLWLRGSWKTGTLDWVYVPGYSVADFMRAVDRIKNGNPGSLIIYQVELSGPPGVRGRKTVQELYELPASTAADPKQACVMRFQIEGPLSYYQFAEFSKVAPITDITRRYFFSQVSIMKKK